MSIELNITSETGALKSVILGYPYNFHDVPYNPINKTQKKYYFSALAPKKELVIEEFAQFKIKLESYGVNVHQPHSAPVTDQLTPRDIGFVVDSTFVVASMAKESRKNEWIGIEHMLCQMQKVIYAPQTLTIEGGDVVVDKGKIYVGLSSRSTIEGAAFLQKQFPDYEVIPVRLKSLDDTQEVLHLDCAFVPVGKESAVIYRNGFVEIPKSIRENYHFLEVTKTEQQSLATNVLSLSENLVMSLSSCLRVNHLLEYNGITVISMKFDEAPKTGGSFRCCSLPLYREDGTK